MSKRTIPQPPSLHSRVDVAIGSRLDKRRGGEPAKMCWFASLARMGWASTKKPAWPTNETIARDAGLGSRRKAEEGVSTLRAAEMITTRWGTRPDGTYGRMIYARLGSPAVVKIPDRHDMANLWEICGERRKRPAPMVTMMTGAYVLACDANGGRRFDEWTPLGCTMAQWRRFVGARKNASWTKRVRECEALDLIRRKGRAVEVAPTRSWLRAARALDSWIDATGPPLAA